MTSIEPKDIKVLIADDEVEFATTLVTRLKLRDFRTTMANSGIAAVESIEKDRPNVLILDLKMPDLDGLEVLARVKAFAPEVQVIIVTGHGSFEAGREGMELGAFDYIMKPVDLSLLVEKIKDAYEARQ